MLNNSQMIHYHMREDMLIVILGKVLFAGNVMGHSSNLNGPIVVEFRKSERQMRDQNKSFLGRWKVGQRVFGLVFLLTLEVDLRRRVRRTLEIGKWAAET